MLPPSPYQVFLIQSAHTDIGYTHPQEQIERMYLDYYDKVLELCRRTEGDPPPQRFKWVCETAWQVKTYLTAHPERTEEFVHYARNGQIEITAAYLHFTDLIDEDAYRRSLGWIADFAARHKLPLRTAMHCDINGWAWALPSLLKAHGVEFFLSQIHIDSATDPLGRPGHVHYHWKLELGSRLKPDVPTRTPQAFWWQGPDGQRVLHWLGEHYHLGNFLGVSGIYQFSALKTRYFWDADQDTTDKLYEVAQRELPRYLDHLRAQGYPYPATLISMGGYLVDNAAPDLRWCEVVARWNAEHEDIKLCTATVSEWYEHLLTLDDGSWPTYQVAWPDHWAHGLGSMTARIGQARQTQRRRPDAVRLAEQVQASQPAVSRLLEAGLEQERLALEHTFNAWMTTHMPWHPQNDFLASHKELTFHRAELYFDEVIAMSLRQLAPAAPDHQRLYAQREAAAPPLRTLHFGAGDYQIDDTTQTLVDDEGHTMPFQRDTHPNDRPRYVAAAALKDAALHGYTLQHTLQPAQAAPQSSVAGRTTLENTHWRLALDPQSGALTSLREVALGREWVGVHQGGYRFGQVVQETVVHPSGRQATSNLARLVAEGSVSQEVREQYGDHPVFARHTLAFEEAPVYRAGPVFDALTIAANSPTLGWVGIAWRSYHALPLIELVIDWDKAWVEQPEAAYVAFPFHNAGDGLKLETAGGFFQPGSHAAGGQLPGTASTYYTVQRAAHIESAQGGGLLWLPLDAPLVMTQDIHFTNWDRQPYTWNGFLASMPVNHYWHTNFPRNQRGFIRLRYRFLSLHGIGDRERGIQMALPLEALGWR